MKLLTAVLVLLVSTNYVIGAGDSSNSTVTTVAPVDTTPAAATSPAASPETSAATVPGSTVPAGTGSTIPAGTGSTAPPGTGSTAPAGTGSTVTDSGNTGTTTGVPTTTPKPLELSTFPVSNDVNVLDAKLILQQAVQLDQQINALNDYLIKAQNDTDPAKSPLFDQLNAFSHNITAQNTTLHGYISQLQNLSASQFALDQRVSSAASTFVCFSQSSCVTDVPTTPEPTSPGPTPTVFPCNNTLNLKTDSDFSKTESYTFASEPNVAPCSIKVLASNQANNVSVTINATFTGPDAYVKLVETRTQQSATINGSITNYVFQGFQEVDVYYFSGPRSTVQFNFTYQEVNNCLLNCTGSNGECKVSQSGVQYCECKKCQFTGDFCEVTLADPCQSKQKRVCGENSDPPYGKCYKNICSDSCYSCACSPGPEVNGTDQKCTQPSPGWSPPVAPTGPTVCPTTAAPSTTTALLTSTAAPIGSSSAAPGSSVAPVSTVTPDSSDTTVSGGPSPSSSAIPIVSSSVAASSSSTAPSDAPSTASSNSTP
ncbi:hypothetical protein L5515_011045 [Caenorhabditis briggsae]|uniref:EGF-like domain-containing protein n=1 Tax=Caenorhabditis briggsae TaxID=6238 RepID=A0AAE9JEX7_CAEBR|nr:hypothetical protein L5515_011045 [Caenorhabditis briggsae]